MTWTSRSTTVTGIVLLIHAHAHDANQTSCYSAQEHAVLSATLAKHAPSQQQAGSPLPTDIAIEAVVATLVICLGLVLGSQPLRPIQWNVWAGKVEREGGKGFLDGSGNIDREFRGNPFSLLESRPGFVDIRRQRTEFTSWAKGNAN
ncbi:hypothetical protein Golomagni_06922 [Golovinomyces magnicellulatus]|nr:hypothetical protein Golomagni_06922 [Golovinomyces magnicellulatus]